MRKLIWISCSSLLLIFVALAAWWIIKIPALIVNATNAPIMFVVPQGASLTQVAQELEAENLIPDAYYFLWLTWWQDKSVNVRAGEYRILPGTTLQMLLQQFTKGQVWLHRITFPEGWTFQQMLNALQAEPNLTHTLNNQTTEQIMAAIGHPGESAEGLFFPDTYLFTPGAKDTRILHAAYDLMQKKLNQAWDTRAAGLPYKTPYEALIVASLIEKETKIASERAIIGGIILKRLQYGMRLQIDASVSYGVKDKKQNQLTRAELLIDSAYNTYTRSGLPPTPIAMPGEASIIAALHPVMSDALYYVAKGDGGHVFSANLSDHNIAVQKYRRYLKSAPERQDAIPKEYLQPSSVSEYYNQQCISGQLWLNSLSQRLDMDVWLQGAGSKILN